MRKKRGWIDGGEKREIHGLKKINSWWQADAWLAASASANCADTTVKFWKKWSQWQFPGN
jgi:hypothetical protein